jgi:hypothetical protein
MTSAQEIYSTVIYGHGVQNSSITGNQFYSICRGSTASATDAAVYLDYQSDRNLITGNQFGLGTSTPRFYIVLQPNGPASNPFLKVPTGVYSTPSF